MTDKQKIEFTISNSIWAFLQDITSAQMKNLHKTHEIIADRNLNIRFESKNTTPRHILKKKGEIAIEIPKLHDNIKELATADIAIAIGRRLERFERGRKANATRTPNSRKEIAQKAIQARWTAK